MNNFHKTEQQKANRVHKVITKVNKQLKDIGKELNIPIALTTYCGRIAYMPFLVFFHTARHNERSYNLIINQLNSIPLSIGNDSETSLVLRSA